MDEKCGVFGDFVVERYVLKNNRYGAPEIFNWDEVLKLKMFDIEINLWEVFEKELVEDKKEGEMSNVETSYYASKE